MATAAARGEPPADARLDQAARWLAEAAIHTDGGGDGRGGRQAQAPARGPGLVPVEDA